MESKWICYMLSSVDSNKTYIGATNNLERRLNNHNCVNSSKKGAKVTRGEQWIVILYVSGFPNKIACLSFEAGLKHVHKRKNKKYKIPHRSTSINKRIINLYNYLDLGSPLKKWSSCDLTINWLETQYKPQDIEFERELLGIINTITHHNPS